jgi:hypothetical protein
VIGSQSWARNKIRSDYETKLFNAALGFTLYFEGGFSDHPSDVGGRTYRGITQAEYNVYRSNRGLPGLDVSQMSETELIEIYNSEPEVDCPECRNGYEPCDHCDATGETQCGRCDGSGEEDCDYCDGSGMDEDSGEECDMCEGGGRMTCGRCNGSGEESCNYCGGDGESTCGYCSGEGIIISKDKVEVQYSDYISWSGRWKGYFFDKKPDQELDYEDTKNFGFNSQTIYLGRYEEISEDYTGYENGDVLLYVTKDTKDLNLTKQYDRIYP